MTPQFEITAAQRAQLDTDGFLLLPGAIPDDLIARMRAADERHRATVIADEGHPDAARACIVDSATAREPAVYANRPTVSATYP